MQIFLDCFWKFAEGYCYFFPCYVSQETTHNSCQPLELYPVWMGRVKNEVEKDEQSDNFRHFHIQLWVSEKRSKE
jgi:hypothetical protein